MAARTSSRARSTAAAYCGDGAEPTTDGTSCDCAKSGAVTTTSWRQKCRERGDDDADRKSRAGRPRREPVARGSHTERDADHHQQHAQDRGAWRVVGVGHIEAHGRDGQAEGDKGECLHGVHHGGLHARSVTETRPRSPHQTVSGR